MTLPGHDIFVQTQRQQQFVTLAAELAEQFAKTSAAHDQANSFPHENFSELHHRGYTYLTVPAEFGGHGASLVETLLAQERLAQGDGSTALAIGWHLATMGKQREARAWSAKTYRRICREVVQQGALLNSCASERATGSPSRGGQPTTLARKESNGHWVLTGRKIYATLSPVLTYAVVSAWVEAGGHGGWFLVPMDTPGVRVEETWNSLGMRATGSHDLVLHEVRLPAEALLEPFGHGRTDQVGTGAGAGWGLHIPATYLGIARAARDFTLRYAHNRRPNSLGGASIATVPAIQAQLGQIELDLLAARSTLYTVAQRWDEAAPDQRLRLVPLLGAAKVLGTNVAIQVVDLAIRVVGLAGLSRDLPLERYYRDVRAGLHNPPMQDAAMASLAKAALREVAEESA